MNDRTPDEKSGGNPLDDDELSSGLNAAFESEAHDASVLETLEVKPLHLPGSEPVPKGDATGRYQLIGEIARGGMGVIYKGRDVDLGRDVAMKVLRTSYKDNAQATERFMEEAQVGGQLQHPGIVPVYELGLDADDQPYFSMKLVKGKTLAALLKEGETSRRRLLSIFEQICQTMAYAHARGVVHRDLKPANVMVGAFGEVQVVDWGFAKVLGQGGVADERRRPDVSVIATVRSRGEGSDSIAGSVMGTPRYMPPEQALGQVDQLDERSDAFGLGAILYELLTGKPIYAQDGPDNPLVLAARCDLEPAFARLSEEELEPLLRECLAASPSDRPKDASYVAQAISDHLAEVDERVHASELEAAEAEIHADGERRKRKLTLVLGGTLLVILSAAAFTWWTIDAKDREQRARAGAEAAEAHDQAITLLGQSKHEEALAAVRISLHLVSTERARTLQTQIQEAQEEARVEAEQRERDATLVAELTRIRSQLGDNRDAVQLHAQFERAFETYGTSPTDADALLEREAVRVAIANTLTEWALIRRDELEHPRADWKALLSTASSIDPHEVRDRIRDEYKLVELAEKDAAKLEPATIDLLAVFLLAGGKQDEAVALLELGRRIHAGDYFLNLRLGMLHPEDFRGARYLQAASVLQPKIELVKTLRDSRIPR